MSISEEVMIVVEAIKRLMDSVVISAVSLLRLHQQRHAFSQSSPHHLRVINKLIYSKYVRHGGIYLAFYFRLQHNILSDKSTFGILGTNILVQDSLY